jgi:hypothetical protein
MTEQTAIVLQALTKVFLLADKTNRPAFAFEFYRSEFVRETVQQSLLAALNRQQGDWRGHEIIINGNNKDFVARMTGGTPKTIFFVMRLRWGKGQLGRDAYRLLNQGRERLQAAGVRALFWLTPREAEDLPRYAPDLWAFRQYVADLRNVPPPLRLQAQPEPMPVPEIGGVALPPLSRLSAWKTLARRYPQSLACQYNLALAAMQAGDWPLAEATIATLPKTAAGLLAKADLLAFGGCWDEAGDLYRQAWKKYQHPRALQGWQQMLALLGQERKR